MQPSQHAPAWGHCRGLSACRLSPLPGLAGTRHCAAGPGGGIDKIQQIIEGRTTKFLSMILRKMMDNKHPISIFKGRFGPRA
eukprot:scaffold119513_cov25-Prasinocladus_malaysianus.AAC.2